MRYSEVLNSLYSISSRRWSLGLERTGRLCEGLGNPQEKFKATHVTGTNGKGSVTAMIAEAIGEERACGRYVSPHVDTFRERIVVDGKKISERETATEFENVSSAARKIRGITFFEFTTGMAFDYFARKRAARAVLEVGMGGRLDATNIADGDSVAITNVGLEHTEWLGKTVEQIAREKCGLIKDGAFVATCETGRALRTIRGECKKRKAELLVLEEDFDYETVECSDLANDYSIRCKRKYEVGLAMLGAHQGKNAALAAAMCEKIGLGKNSIERGISRAVMPCRLEVVSRKPLVIMDGAHNPHGARELAKSLKLFKREFVFVIGVMKTKDARGFLMELAGLGGTAIVTSSSVPGALGTKKLEKIAEESGIFGEVIAVEGADEKQGVGDEKVWRG
ncbi:MAG: Mur ligase family protein [Candidatus Micrarchaeota archaeon]|nr:Mur ligase family protein [Candidatus Micrarchaeota archaeon]